MHTSSDDDPETKHGQPWLAYLVPMIILSAIFNWGYWWIFILFFAVIPMIAKVVRRYDDPYVRPHQYQGEKRKNEDDNSTNFFDEDDLLSEKPKNDDVRYVIGDDGELVAIESKEKRPRII